MAKNLKKMLSVRLSEEHLALLDRLAERYGGKSAAIVLALEALERGGETSPAEALAVLQRFVAERAG